MTLNLMNETTDCEDCKRLRSGLTWTGEPPKCPKHAEYNVTWTGGLL